MNAFIYYQVESTTIYGSHYEKDDISHNDKCDHVWFHKEPPFESLLLWGQYFHGRWFRVQGANDAEV